jgi:YggT family protein
VGIVCAIITIFIVVLFVRAVMSWFPHEPGSFSSQLYRLLIDLTDWVLRPLRTIIPPAGMFDLSFLVTVLILFFLRTALCG